MIYAVGEPKRYGSAGRTPGRRRRVDNGCGQVEGALDCATVGACAYADGIREGVTMMFASNDADAIVIGAGTGGLTAAAYLAVMGHRVVVVDRQSMPGGNTSAFTHEGYEFDIGLHYLGGWRGAHPGIRGVLEPLGVDLRYREQDPEGFDEVLFDDMTFLVPRGVEEFRARLRDVFPDERAAIDRHLRRIASIAGEFEAQAPVRMDVRSLMGMPWRMPVTAATARMTLGHEFERLGCSPRLRAVLNWCHAVYAVAPSRVALAMHALAAMHYLAGAWYPEGGGPAVVNALVDVISSHGGEIILDAEVGQIVVDSEGVRGVRLVEGRDGGASSQLRAPLVVSAADLKHTYLDLLASPNVRPRVLRRVRRYRMAAPLFVVYAVLDRDLRAEGVPNRNWWVYGDDDIDGQYAACDRGELPSGHAFITSASLKDPTNPRLCRAGQTNIQIMWIAPAAHDFWGAGETYAQRKREMRDALLAAADRAIPGITGAIVYEETASPMTWERYVHNSGGSSYGIAATPDQFLLRRPGPKTHIPGLYLAGASTRTAHGITGVALGGMEAAAIAAGAPTWPRVHPHPMHRAAPQHSVTQ